MLSFEPSTSALDSPLLVTASTSNALKSNVKKCCKTFFKQTDIKAMTQSEHTMLDSIRKKDKDLRKLKNICKQSATSLQSWADIDTWDETICDFESSAWSKIDFGQKKFWFINMERQSGML